MAGGWCWAAANWLLKTSCGKNAIRARKIKSRTWVKNKNSQYSENSKQSGCFEVQWKNQKGTHTHIHTRQPLLNCVLLQP